MCRAAPPWWRDESGPRRGHDGPPDSRRLRQGRLSFLRSWFAQHPQLAYAEGGIAGFPDVHALARDAASQDDRPLYRVTSSEGLATPHTEVGRPAPDYREDASSARWRAHGREPARLLGGAVSDRAHPDRDARLPRDDPVELFAICAHRRRRVAGVALRRGGTSRGGRWNYDLLIGLYRQAFGGSNAIVLPYELLRDDERRSSGEIARRLGLADIGVPPDGRTLRSRRSSSPGISGYAPRPRAAARRVGTPQGLATVRSGRHGEPAARADRAAATPAAAAAAHRCGADAGAAGRLSGSCRNAAR